MYERMYIPATICPSVSLYIAARLSYVLPIRRETEIAKIGVESPFVSACFPECSLFLCGVRAPLCLFAGLMKSRCTLRTVRPFQCVASREITNFCVNCAVD